MQGTGLLSYSQYQNRVVQNECMHAAHVRLLVNLKGCNRGSTLLFQNTGSQFVYIMYPCPILIYHPLPRPNLLLSNKLSSCKPSVADWGHVIGGMSLGQHQGDLIGAGAAKFSLEVAFFAIQSLP